LTRSSLGEHGVAADESVERILEHGVGQEGHLGDIQRRDQGREGHEQDCPACNGGGLVANALEFTGNLHAAGDLAQFKLPRGLCQQVERHAVYLDFKLVEGLIGLKGLPGERFIAVEMGAHRAGDHTLGVTRHDEELFLVLIECLLIEGHNSAATALGQCIPSA
jgi:hypothetical protein